VRQVLNCSWGRALLARAESALTMFRSALALITLAISLSVLAANRRKSSQSEQNVYDGGMDLGPSSHEELMLSIEHQCSEALDTSYAMLVKVISLNMNQAGIPHRVAYMMAGLKALGETELHKVGEYFQNLTQAVPRSDMMAHQQAVEMVYQHMVDHMLDQTKRMADALAGMIGVEKELVFTGTIGRMQPALDELPPFAPGSTTLH
jgi:hypothetical protein